MDRDSRRGSVCGGGAVVGIDAGSSALPFVLTPGCVMVNNLSYLIIKIRGIVVKK